jgi:hypothetical protein
MANRRLSSLSSNEMSELEAQLEVLYDKYKDEETGVSSAALTQFASECNLLNKDLKDLDVELTFQAVKLGKKETLNFDRFKEACRKMAVKRECTYHVLIQIATG